MEYPLSIWWWGIFCPLQGYPFDRVLSSQIARGVPEAVRGARMPPIPCRGHTPAHRAEQGRKHCVPYRFLERGSLLCFSIANFAPSSRCYLPVAKKSLASHSKKNQLPRKEELVLESSDGIQCPSSQGTSLAAGNVGIQIRGQNTIAINVALQDAVLCGPSGNRFQALRNGILELCQDIGCITQINDHLFEGHYSPMWINDKKHSRNVYAHTREECEEKLKVLIVEMKAELAELKK